MASEEYNALQACFRGCASGVLIANGSLRLNELWRAISENDHIFWCDIAHYPADLVRNLLSGLTSRVRVC